MNCDTAERKNKLGGFPAYIRDQIRGQDNVLHPFCAHLLRSEQGLIDPKLPLGGWIFAGPTGVGKTELAKQFSHYFFGSERIEIIDMSEYMDKSVYRSFIARILEGKRRGVKVFLFDEFDKADIQYMNLFLQMLDSARISSIAEVGDKGETISLSDCYLILTCNMGAEQAMKSRTRNRVSFENTVRYHIEKDIKKPEIIARIDLTGGILVFDRLDGESMGQVADVQIRKICDRMLGVGNKVKLSEKAREWVKRRGFSKDFGARPLKKVLAQYVEGAIAQKMFDRDVKCVSGTIDVTEDSSLLELRLE
jgi:ATP-dependent Clp protease ATP-binding subunit ClpC